MARVVKFNLIATKETICFRVWICFLSRAGVQWRLHIALLQNSIMIVAFLPPLMASTFSLISFHDKNVFIDSDKQCRLQIPQPRLFHGATLGQRYVLP